MFCVKCGQNLPDDALFCVKCGSKTVISQEKVVHTDTLKNSTSEASITYISAKVNDACEVAKLENLQSEEVNDENIKEMNNSTNFKAKNFKWIKMRYVVGGIILIFTVSFAFLFITQSQYTSAIALMNANKYSEAIYKFEDLKGYKDSINKIRECKYNIAVDLLNQENYIEAYETLISLNGYEDSAQIAASIYYNYKVEKLKMAKIGDHVLFGSYEQDNNTQNGKEDVEWLVLDKKDERILVISKYGLDVKPYNTEYEAVTWEDCSLRKWLNNFFLNDVFSELEQAMIPIVKVSADSNPEYESKPGKATMDKLFLLSAKEVNMYFASNDAKKCIATEYLCEKSAYMNGYCFWWLRTPGFTQQCAVRVSRDGEIIMYGESVHSDDINAVRPAFWIDLNS